MTNYKFYVITNNDIKYFDTLGGAKSNFKEVIINDNTYIALGITNKKTFDSIDLLISKEGYLKISNDYKFTSFKDDKMVTLNIINVLENFKNELI